MPLVRLWRLRRWRVIAAVLLLTALAAAAAVEAETYYVRDRLAESVYGSAPHRVPCEEWPTPGEVHQAIDRNADLITRIESVNPGFVSVEVSTAERCPGRADIRVLYASRGDREAIRAIVGHEKFLFGVPYRLQNT